MAAELAYRFVRGLERHFARVAPLHPVHQALDGERPFFGEERDGEF